MPYTFINYHFIIFPKYYRSVFQKHSSPLYDVIEKRLNQIGCKPLAINGGDDHIHIVSEGSPLISPEDIVEDIWDFTKEWIENTKSFPMFIGWEKNYVMWSLSTDETEEVKREIQNQKRFHRSSTLSMELRSKGIFI